MLTRAHVSRNCCCSCHLLIMPSSHENTPYLPGIELSELVVATITVKDATEGADIVFVVVPTPFVRGETL